MSMNLCTRMRLLTVHAGLVVFLWVMVGIMSTLKPFPSAFFERDMDIGHALVHTETVSTAELFVYSLVLPLLAVYAYIFGLRFLSQRNWSCTHYALHVQKERWMLPMMGPAFLILEAVGLATMFTYILKLYVGRWRPNGLSLCDYKGYRAAADSGDFAQWLSVTGEWAFGNFDGCQASGHDVDNAHMSFPSGHSSMAFAGLTALSIFIYVSFVAPANKAHQIPWFVPVLLPVSMACLIAGSRCRDNYHFWGDVVCGSLIGFICAFMAAALNINPISSAPSVRKFGGGAVDSVLLASDVDDLEYTAPNAGNPGQLPI